MVSSNPGHAEAIVTHAERSISEDEIVAAARERAEELGAGAVTPAVGALLSVLARLTGAGRSSRSAPARASAVCGCCPA
ncbi:O-methyltransferase family protein [Mycolicibacterium fortuitum]|uniref:O-methyltransferase family protein n=1 Tax=Mycolicibacterium fortuitum TaxID=1766 RepID=A0A378UUE8_MYCFO|nr:O-methyltransferase family protein [Mycolicibacterium fortuitum]